MSEMPEQAGSTTHAPDPLHRPPAPLPGALDRAPKGSRRLGGALVAAGLLSEDELAWALFAQRRTGSRLGQILLAEGFVSRPDLYRVLAELWDAPYVDVTTTDLDPKLTEGLDPSQLSRELWVPVERLTDGRILVATAEAPDAARARAVEHILGAPVTLAVTTEWDVNYALQRMCGRQLLDDASNGLWRADEDRSARKVLTPPQVLAGLVCLLTLAGALLASPTDTVVATITLLACGFSASVGFKFAICLAGAYHEGVVEVTDAEVAAMGDAELPIYTVLVPCYHEANVVPQLMANLGDLDYPQEKLEILLLLEEDDTETRAAAAAARPPATVTFLTVPSGPPQTKPKACNVGLMFARGEYLVIYDAEDRPEPSQLKRAIAAFRKGGDDLVCIQAALNYFNSTENALTKLFTLEYSFWFDYMLPGLDALRLPIPLGGTSNHFRTDALRRLGGWDPYNVTEDADLGIRAAALGKRVGVVNSTTFEEANNAYGNFVRQRSRWIKGYMQTTLVHLRHPVDLVRTTGWRQALSFALLVAGTPISFLTVPPLYVLTIVFLFVSPAELGHYIPAWVVWLGVANFLVGNALMIYVAMMGVFKRRQHRLVFWALLNPLYWLLHALGAYKALWQLAFRPHYWEKTLHGLSATDPSATSH